MSERSQEEKNSHYEKLIAMLHGRMGRLPTAHEVMCYIFGTPEQRTAILESAQNETRDE